jgi:phosphate transport system permease protein
VNATAATIDAQPVKKSGAGADRAFQLITAGAAWFVLLLLGAIALSMAWGGRLAFQTFGWRFVTSSQWDAVGGHFGALVPIYGTLVTSAIALIIAVPVSIGIALFLTDIAPRWSRGPIAMAIELLAAIPSIIYGMWGLFVFAPFMALHVEPWLSDHLGSKAIIGPLFSGPPIGIGMLTAGIVLGIMVIPFIAAVAREVFSAVPAPLRESAVALGSTRWEILSRVTLPYTRSAIIGAVFLGLGRALGETMAVTEADTDLYRSSLIALGFLLFVVTVIVLSIAKLLLLRVNKQMGRTS